MTLSEDILATSVQNVVSYSVIAITFRVGPFLPTPDRMIEWLLSIAVAISIFTYNVVRTVQAIRNRKSK